MALNLSQYVDPGVYIGEVVVPGSVSVVASPLSVCLVGTGVRSKRATNEAVTRGLVSGEELSFEENVHLGGEMAAKLEHLSNRRSSQLSLFKDGAALDASQFWYGNAYVVGASHPSALDMSVNNSIALSLDGKQPVVIQVATGASDSVTLATDGNLIVRTKSGLTMNSVSLAALAEAINAALAGAADFGYGSAYGSVASVHSNKLVVKSPIYSQASNVIAYSPFDRSATSTVFGADELHADAYVVLDGDVYADSSAFTASYIATDSSIDALASADISTVRRVGNYAGVTSYAPAVDYTLVDDSIQWNVAESATMTSQSGSFDLLAGSILQISVDGKSTLSIDISLSTVPGSVVPADISAVSADDLATNINAALAHALQYGPAYASVAQVDADKVVLTSPSTGRGSSFNIGPTGAASVIFGLSLQQLSTADSLEAIGSGGRPGPGSIYFATYEYKRPASDYNVAKRYYNSDALYTDIGSPSANNKLAVAASLCFENGAPSVMVVQVDDRSFLGNPTRAEVKAALDAAGLNAAATDICLLDAREICRADLVAHVTEQCSPVIKNWRRGWFGMPRGTQAGDKDTPGTFVHTAVHGLSVPPDSPARGRLVLVAPGSVTATVVSEGGTINVDVDSSFVAAAIAARMTSFTSPSDTLLRKSITGFLTDSFPVYMRAERAQLASNGVTVVTLDAGQLKLTDPVTTEDGGGKLATFREISASTQKDAVVQAVNDVVDSNLVGVVPSDMSVFMLSVKSFIADAINSLIATGAIGPFKTTAGTVREIDYAQDIQVLQDRTDPTKFSFKYYFNLRLPAKRFFGEYSVNNPFFGQ